MDSLLLLDLEDSAADFVEGLAAIVVVGSVVGSEVATVVDLVEVEEVLGTRVEVALAVEAEAGTVDPPMASVTALHHLPTHPLALVVGPAFLVGMAVVAMADRQLTVA